jgi:glyoxylase-like metal-dependent hydrolase (beta-lactamase superfamily II)
MKVYNVGNRIMNTYLYRIKDGYVMIDTGYENRYIKCTSSMKREGISWDNIKYIFLTHAHDDHAGFLKEVLDKHSNITCIISHKAFPVLAKGQNSFNGGCSSGLALFFCNIMKFLGNGEHLFPAIDETYINRFIEITQDNVTEIERLLSGRILFTPGHTMDSISLKVENLIFCGDAAMNGLPSLHRITIWIENKKEFENSWQILLDADADYIYPAHGKRFRSSDLYKFKPEINKVKLYPLK